MEKNFEITWAGLWRVVGILILAAIFYYALDIWLAVLLAIVISSALDGSVTWLERKKIPRLLGAFGVYLLIILIIALVLYTVVPMALSELTTLLNKIGRLDSTAFGLEEAAKIITVINQGLNQLANLLLGGNISFFNILSQFVGGASLVAAVFILSFYLTVDRDGVEKFLLEIMPSGYEEKVMEVYYRTRMKIGRWLYGQLFLSLSVGLAVFVGLWFIGVKYSLVLAILTGLLEIVPFAGPIISGTVAFLIAAPDSLSVGVYVLILYFVVHQAESNFLMPLITRFTTNLNPVAVLISILVGARLFGFIGIVLAVPLAVTIEELMETWTTEKTKRRAAASSS